MQSKAATVAEYLASLPEERRTALETVRKVILANIDKDFEEGMGYGMMGWSVPHSIFPAGYHCDPRIPLPFAGMASQKGHMSLYAMCLYGHGNNPTQEWFRKAWAKSGKKLDMGKSCIRFKKVDDLALDVIAELFRRVTARKYIADYETGLEAMGKASAERSAARAAAKTPAKKASPKKKTAAKRKAPKKPAAKR